MKLSNKAGVNGIIVVFTGILLSSCGAMKPYYGRGEKDWAETPTPDSVKLLYSTYLIGDCGSPAADKLEPSFKLMESMIYSDIDTNVVAGDSAFGINDTVLTYLSNPRSSVIFLGDNIYDFGMPAPDDNNRAEMERRIVEQMKVVKEFKGGKYFIPGNHDWNKSNVGGWAANRREELFVEAYFDSANVYRPDRGCPGPVELHPNPNQVLVIMDSEWWLHKHFRPFGAGYGCEAQDELDVIVQLEDIISRNGGKNIVICLHHPMVSNGNHGGHYSLGDYVFPLRVSQSTVTKYIQWLPLFPIGSIYPLMRKYGIARQDIPNPKYQALVKNMLAIVRENPNVVIASGHEHNLQLHPFGDAYQIVSGSGTKSKYAIKGNGADFSYAHKGFSKLNYYENGEVWVEFWEAIDDGDSGKLVFRKLLYSIPPSKNPYIDPATLPSYQDSTRVVMAGASYQKGGFHRLFFGDHYRQAWATPVRVNYLDMATYAGGLSPIKKGGGNQTISLRLMGKDEMQYALRSIDKNPEFAVPEEFRGTWITDVLQDQISSAHPYGALAVPGLAEPLGVFHTHPDLVYVPRTPLLGPYVDDIGDMLALIEIRPDEDLRNFARFGNSTNVVSTRRMLEQIREDNDNAVDQRAFLKARYLDMLLGDWDRHQDQWRWAEFDNKGKGEAGKGEVYRPIPRDRDQAFVLLDGIIPWLGSRRWTQRNLENYGYKFHDVVGLNASGRGMDIRILTELTYDEWMELADSVQIMLTDEDIDKAFKELPPEVYTLDGEVMAAKMKSRRDDLKRAAAVYYKSLAKEVEITGSDKHELFKVDRQEDGKVLVTVYKMKKEGDVIKVVYERLFDPKETKEIRLYGFDGNDKFELNGKSNKSIKVRMIGGEGDDSFINNSNGGGLARHTFIYDDLDSGNVVQAGKDSKVIRASGDWVNEYITPDRPGLNYFGPVAAVELNPDDGLFLGGGVRIQRLGWRKRPYKSEYVIKANYALQTQAFSASYESEHVDFFGRTLDFNMLAEAFGPKYVLNYFGDGNETKQTLGIDFYRIKMNQVLIEPTVVKRFSLEPVISKEVIEEMHPNARRVLSRFMKVGFGPFFEYNSVEEDQDASILNSINTDVSSEELLPTYYVGGRLFMEIKVLNHWMNPTRGIYWHNELRYHYGMEGAANSFTKLSTDFKFYVTPNIDPVRITFALRLGGEKNLGDYNFYQSAFLGNQDNIRGYRQNRFAGHSLAYENFDIRMSIFNFNNTLFNGSGGFLGFFDAGRVWSTADTSDMWHFGYGPGLWVDFYNLVVLSAHYGISDIDKIVKVQMGFFF